MMGGAPGAFPPLCKTQIIVLGDHMLKLATIRLLAAPLHVILAYPGFVLGMCKLATVAKLAVSSVETMAYVHDSEHSLESQPFIECSFFFELRDRRAAAPFLFLLCDRNLQCLRTQPY